MRFPVISADAHITEPPNTYSDGGEGAGDMFGEVPTEIRVMGVRLADLHRRGWDREARLADQDTDGVTAVDLATLTAA